MLESIKLFPLEIEGINSIYSSFRRQPNESPEEILDFISLLFIFISPVMFR